MTEYLSILNLLTAERDRYILEASDLERRLCFIRNQMANLEALISGYATEEQMYSAQRHLSHVSSTQAILHDSYEDVDESDYETNYTEQEPDYTEQDTGLESHTETNNNARAQTDPVIPNSPSPIPVYESTVASAQSPDISDIPKLIIPRKSGNVPLLSEFQEYSVQNAVLILMRRRPDLHMHIDAVVRDLYGDLSPIQFKKAKSNVTSALSAGLNMGLWYRVMRTSGVYTLHYEKGVTTKPPSQK